MSSSLDLYQEVTDRIVEMLEQGVAPWRSPIMGSGSAGYPKNLASGKPYRGVNVFLHRMVPRLRLVFLADLQAGQRQGRFDQEG